tara:strand:+ start:85 stop:549 length:465 start_codon:yes stop_codon:yes gene_type:complete
MNFWTIVLGVLLAVGLLSALVLVTIGEAGNINLSESMQKCILNYFQVAALFVNIPLRWPGPMQTLFDFQGAISTIGEHLVNPDCIATDSSAAELFYAKQLAFLLAPILLVITVLVCGGCMLGRPEKNGRDPKTRRTRNGDVSRSKTSLLSLCAC